MDKLRFFHIQEDYVRFLYKIDCRVQHNKGEHRPYVGVVLSMGEHDYYVPLESPKPNHMNIKSGGPVMKLDEGRLGIMGFNNMIPVKKHQLLEFDILGESDIAYRNLLLNQLRFCEKHREQIYARAQATYRKATSGTNPFYRKVCCDYKRLEEACNTYRGKKTTVSFHLKPTPNRMIWRGLFAAIQHRPP